AVAALGTLCALLLGVHVLAGVELDLAGVLLPAGGHEVELADHEGEHQEVEHEVDRAHDDHPTPAGLGVALHDAEEGQVDEAAGEGHTHAHVEDVHEHVGSTGKHAVDDVHGGSHKEEGELQGLGDTGNHGGKSGGEQQAAHHLAVFRPGAAVHSQSSAGQAENHQGELTAHEARG